MKVEHKSIQKKALALAVSLAIPAMSMSVVQAEESAKLEEEKSSKLEVVTVTAQKRVQTLLDVPVSVSVVTGDAISKKNMANLDELSTHVPNLSINEGSQTTAIIMRGLGSGINQGFEQSVGMFIDGIYAGRDRQFRSSFMDIASVEVLRGPQGTLFGKNTSAGAINLTTVKPTEDFEALLRSTYDPEYNNYSVEGVVSGGITDNLYGRLSVKQAESNGYMENTFTDRDESSNTETVIRGTLVWEPIDDLSVTTKYETATYDVSGEANVVDESGGWDALFKLTDPDYNGSDNYSRSAAEELSENENESLTVTIDYDIGEYTLTSITGYSGYEYQDLQDTDFSPLDILTTLQDQEFSQLSQELRITSPIGDNFDFIAGLYYQASDLEHSRRFDTDIGPAAGAVPTFGLINGQPAPVNGANVVNLLDAATFVAPPLAPAFIPTNASAGVLATASQGLESSRIADFDQDSETWAVFGQGTWYVQDNLNLILGLRYTKETKEAQRSMYISEYRTDDPLTPANPKYAMIMGIQKAIFGASNFAIEDDMAVEDISPSLKAQYYLNDNVMLYGSVSKAFKSGGFAETGGDGTLETFSFDDEEALAFELGGKLHLMDGRGSLNFAIFQTNYENLQVSSFVGDSFVVSNAAQATSQGVEVDGAFLLTDDLTMTASLAYLDATYDDYKDASCTLAQIQESGTSAKSCTQDLTGKVLPYAPEWSANIGLNHITSIGESLELHSNLNLNYIDEQYLAQDLDEQTLEDSHVTVNARIALGGIDGNWELALVGKNLTNEEIRSYSNDIPLMSGAFYTYMAPPRTIALQFSLSYY